MVIRDSYANNLQLETADYLIYFWLGKRDLFQLLPDKVSMDDERTRDVHEIRQMLDEGM
jgi:hypothetical protein